MAAQVIADVLAEAGAGIVHGEDNSHDGEVRILASLLDSLHQVENFTNPSKAKYSHWTGTRIFSAATRALVMRRPTLGGQSRMTRSNAGSRRRGSRALRTWERGSSIPAKSISAPARSSSEERICRLG